ncbi:MAG: CvpA family protein [Alphaproteobacteria bacterium]|nr:CvpA family protein [Alphaproteobacteria bacterium]
MEQLNNLDVIFLILIGLSALVGIARGFTKELLSIVGWLVAAVCVYYLTPIINPIMKNYISSEMLSTLVSGMLILLVVCIFWVLAVDKIASSIRQSKLSPLDRIFGMFFGILRGVIVVVLIEMMIVSVIPEDSKKGVFAESKIFQIAGDIATPVREMIPEETLDSLHEQIEKYGFKSAEEEKEDAKEETKDKKDTSVNAQDSKDGKDKKEDKAKKDKKSDKKDEAPNISEDAEKAFLELVQPKIEDALTPKDDDSENLNDEFDKFIDSLEEKTIKTDTPESEDFGL